MLASSTHRTSDVTQDVSFAHHEASALHLVEDSPPPEKMLVGDAARYLADVEPDHVLRNAHSFAARSTRSFAASDSLHPPAGPRRSSGPVLAEIDPNNQLLRSGLNRYGPSPTPSLEKTKAEQILKDHGSPPGLRVTAGGRIVPSDQSPLCSPRFGYSAIQRNGGLIRFAPNYPPPPGAAALQETSKNLPNGFVAQDPGGRLLQVVDGQFLPVNEINGLPQLYIAAPNLSSFLPGKVEGSAGQGQGDQRHSGTSAPPRMRQPTLTTSIQLQALDKQYAKLEQESRELDKLEVLQRSNMSSKAYQQLVQTRRELVTRLNDIRISSKALRDQQKNSPEHSSLRGDEQPSPQQQSGAPFVGLPMFKHDDQLPVSHWTYDGLVPEAQAMMQCAGNAVIPMPIQMEMGFFVPHNGALPGQLPTYAAKASNGGTLPPLFNMMGVPPTDMGIPFVGAVPGGPSATQNQVPFMATVPRTQAAAEVGHSLHETARDFVTSEKGSPRRSHALEIRYPDIKSEAAQSNKSSLNPMSPSYQPASIGTRPYVPQAKPSHAHSNSPSPALAEAVRAHNAWVGETRAAATVGHSKRTYGYESSNASFTTADFFPTNPRDHSANKQAYPATRKRSSNSSKQREDACLSTPDGTLGTPEKERHNPNWNPTIPDTTFDTTITSTIEQQGTSDKPVEDDSAISANEPIDRRSQHNMSPKSRRPDLLLRASDGSTEENPTAGGKSVPQTTVRPRQERNTSTSSTRLPVSNAGSAYMDGFRAGESRMPIGPQSSSVWLDGYCAGLRASMNAQIDDARPSSNEMPTKDKASGKQFAVDVMPQGSDQQTATRRPPLELNVASLDTLKEAIFCPQNENVLLSLDSSGGVTDDTAWAALGGCAKQHEASSSKESVLIQIRNGEAAFPERTASMVQRQLSPVNVSINDGKRPASQTASEPKDGGRSFSVRSQPDSSSKSSYFKAVYPGQRVLSSQLEWKPGTSIAQVAALGDMPLLTRKSGNAGANVGDARLSPTKNVSAAPSSPSSPPGTPRFVEGSMGASSTSSPSKKSPTKAKFAHIAGKAGIKVRIEEQSEQERVSTRDKGRWRDVWRKGH
ncbi:hypothetical protein AAFC00_006952 [Neodothiora populina]|uniref:Uncharacterized protein n=1 Tax=Neodothiora populina TaxID=2781224 RepID=A0ABR3PBQ2_9PEZI